MGHLATFSNGDRGGTLREAGSEPGERYYGGAV